MRAFYLLLLPAAGLGALVHCSSTPRADPIRYDAGTDGATASGDAAYDGGFFCGELTTTWSRCPQNPLYVAGKRMPDGNLEMSVGDPDVQYDAEEKKWKAWWSTGAAKTFGEGNNAPIYIKYAESPDGLHWDVQPEPVLLSGTDPTNWDNSKVETPTVIKVASNPPERRYVMFYAGGNDVDFPRLPTLDYTWYQIGVAFSADGKRFTRMPASESPYAGLNTGFRKVEGLLLLARDAFPGTANVENGVVADPEVVFDGSRYHLFFSSLATRADRTTYLTYGVSHATIPSMAAPRLTLAAGNPQILGAAQPSIIHTEEGYELYAVYDSPEDNGRVPTTFNPYYGIWKHTSKDLGTFSAKPAKHDFTAEGAGPNETYGMVKAGDMAYADGIRRYYYPTLRSDNVPTGFFAPLRRDAGMFPDGSIDFPDAGFVAVPAVIALQVAARR
jgi:hypothetical protein